MVQTSGTTGQDAPNRADVSLIAHRGFAGVYPENTVAAVEQAASGVAVGASPEMVEIDVMPTADGEIVTFHDSDLGRVTDAPADLADRKVWETPYETLAELDVLGTGERVPTLEEILDALPADVGVNVEFKNPGSADVRPRENLPPEARDEQRELWQEFAEDVLDALSATDHEVLVSSFAEGALAAVREADPSVPVAAVFADSIADGMEIARRYDCEAVHPPWNAIADTTLFNAEYGTLGPFEDIDVVELAHEEGREVNAWTVERWYEADRLRRAGVDGVIADYPGVLQFGGAAD
ncbi:glycerophosphodiester phosphodiesterase [Halorussus gelatinilyticus]|uniref:Glycerophosphodiester phosphodiesterase n=1 Tax=Halorussus gelatinilyticus TaxID=2937524 RepID=A0A8U0IKD6_9EURY|nr:glycerophosphodiester phosphodiesterase [Halorussus gelatinilyticus]UPW00684.1 glycerophosphodiester phosphodiesterase [Halorussus gelatinilyticus]